MNQCDCGLHLEVADLKQRVDRLVRQMESLLYALLTTPNRDLEMWDQYNNMLNMLEKK